MSGSYLSGIFGKSPVGPLQEHMQKVVSCVSELVHRSDEDVFTFGFK